MRNTQNKNSIYEGRVRHHRFKPKRHKFSYKVFSFLVDLDDLNDLSESLRFFSRNKFNLFSFYDRDHGNTKAEDLAKWVREELKKAKLPNDGLIQFLFYPRVLGYAFNPIVVYYCYDSSKNLCAILYAVRNTFGGRHAYLIPVEGNKKENAKEFQQQADKIFHVSPFIDMNMSYQFSGCVPESELSLKIQVDDIDGPLMIADFSGARACLNDKVLKRLFWRYPMMTIKVVIGIHWEAMKLFSKGLPLKKGDPDPEVAVSVVRSSEIRALSNNSAVK